MLFSRLCRRHDGDMLVMGGTCQRTHKHTVPARRKALDAHVPRIVCVPFVSERVAICDHPLGCHTLGRPAGRDRVRLARPLRRRRGHWSEQELGLSGAGGARTGWSRQVSECVD